MRKKFLAGLLALVMLLSLVPVTAFAAEGIDEHAELLDAEGLEASKVVEVKPDGTFNITLEAYATGTVSTTETHMPLDIVLVLDQSGSMADPFTSQSNVVERWVVSKKSYAELNANESYHKCGENTYGKINVSTTWTDAGLFSTATIVFDCENCDFHESVSGKNLLNYYLSGPAGGIISGAEDWADEIYIRETSSTTTSVDRIDALKAAVNSFIGKVEEDAVANDVDHRIAIVGFASASGYGNNSEILSIAGNNTAISQSETIGVAYNNLTTANYQSALVSCNAEILDKAVEALAANGATRTDVGMDMAQRILQADLAQTPGNLTARKRIVIMFTDGTPTSSDRFDSTVANNTIEYAGNIKNPTGSIKGDVYTIGIFDGADNASPTAASTNENRFMHATSSNYLYATSYTIPTMGDLNKLEYYFKADNDTALNNVFTTIYGSIATSGTTLNSEAVMRDIIADSFQLPEEVEVDDYIKNHITVQTVNYTGKDASGNFTFDEANPAALDATVTVNNDKTIDVKGFDFSAEYCVDTNPVKGKKLIIKIEGLELDPDNYVEGQVYTNGRGSGVYDQDGNLVEEFPRPSVMLGKHSYVVDYAKSFDMHANEFNQDDGFDHLAVDPISFETPNLSGLDLTNGKVVVKDSEANTLTYIPQTMNWNGYDTFYVFGHNHIDDDNFDLWSQINVIPANNVYYEDDFVSTPTDTEESEAVVGITYGDGWKVEYGESGTTDGNTETVDGKVQGWEEQLSDDATFSDNAAHVAGAGATATFTFTGTGVDIYSYTDMNSGMVVGMLYEGTDTTATMTKLLMIDNFAQSGEYYQIPTLSFQDLDHGTYTVKLVVNKLKVQNEDGTIATDETGETKYRDTYYLDGIRIYNPIQNIESTDEIVQDAYIEKDEETGNITSTELNAVFTEVRDILIDANMYDSEGDNTGAVFVDQTVYNEDTDTTGASIGVYEDYGPKNGVYLAKGQHITFKVDSSDAMYQIGLKAPEGATTATWSGSSEFNYTGEINHSTDLYYKTAPAGGYITITNNGDNLLSVTKIKTTGATAESASLMLLSMTEEEAVAEVSAFSLRTAMAYDAAPEEELPESPVEPEVPEKPETPEEPTEPEVPEEPETPEEPTEPEVPDIDIEIENPEPKPEEKPVQKPNHHENLKKLVNSLFKIMSGWFGR